jgi:hypothetical protein
LLLAKRKAMVAVEVQVAEGKRRRSGRGKITGILEA